MVIPWSNYVQLNLAIWLLWIVAVTSIRVSILHLYIVIFRKTWFHRMAYALMFICTVWCIAFMVSYFLVCRPLTKHPRRIRPCGEGSLRDIIGNVLNLGLDVVILSMPMPLLWALHIPLKKKMALCAIFGIGFGWEPLCPTTCLSRWQSELIVSPSRISVFCGVRQKTIVATSNEYFIPSLAYIDVDFGLWLAAEPLLAIITANLPLIAHVFSKLSSYYRRLRTQRLQQSNTNRELNNHGWALSSFHRDRLNPHRFERLHTGPRSHRMADSVESSFHTTTISSVSPALLSNQDRHGQINVTTDWVVESSSCVV